MHGMLCGMFCLHNDVVVISSDSAKLPTIPFRAITNRIKVRMIAHRVQKVLLRMALGMWSARHVNRVPSH